jgi:hypothetical protein
MTAREAQQILMLYRPGTDDAEDPEVIQAMAVARQDPALGRWFQEHAAFQNALRAKLRQVDVPLHLKAALQARGAITRPPQPCWWQRPILPWLAAAVTALLVCGGLAAFWIRPAAPNQFANYQERVVSDAIRQYAMDWKTTDMSSLRQSIGSRGGPSDYIIPKGLEKLRLTGGGILNWRSNPVSMVCFDRGDGQMLFLFVMKRQAIKDPPPTDPKLAKTDLLMTASWSQGDNTYVLAGPEEPGLAEFARKYL